MKSQTSRKLKWPEKLAWAIGIAAVTIQVRQLLYPTANNTLWVHIPHLGSLICVAIILVNSAQHSREKRRQTWGLFAIMFVSESIVTAIGIGTRTYLLDYQVVAPVQQALIVFQYAFAVIAVALYLPRQLSLLGNVISVILDCAMVGCVALLLLQVGLPLLFPWPWTYEAAGMSYFLALDIGVCFAVGLLVIRYYKRDSSIFFGAFFIATVCQVLADSFYMVLAWIPGSTFALTDIATGLYMLQNASFALGVHWSTQRAFVIVPAKDLMPRLEWFAWTRMSRVCLLIAFAAVVLLPDAARSIVVVGILILAMMREILATYQERQMLSNLHTATLQEQKANALLSNAHEQTRIAKEAAESASRAKSIFLANMSHELRTPLNAILGFSGLMARDPALTSAQRRDLETINRSGAHLLGLINDVLELSKIEAGRIEINRESFDLYYLLSDLEALFKLQANTKGLVLSFERAHDVPQYIRASRDKLRQVLTNLLGNAIKFTEQGEITLRVTLSPPSSLCFTVGDTGIGIPPEKLGTIFDTFRQVTTGKFHPGGTGLGLHLSREYVRLMGGELTVKSELGRGSIFGFSIPVEETNASETQPELPSRKIIGLEPGQHVRVLVADDQDTSRELLIILLKSWGFEVREASDGQEAVCIWEEWRPDLIWMDIRMPVLDGLEATQRIKAAAGGQVPTIVAVTAHAFENERAEILAAGCDDFVRKPISEVDIADAMIKHLGVKFVYEDGSVQTASMEQTVPLTGSDLAVLSKEWITSLRDAAIMAHSDSAFAVIDKIESEQAQIATSLKALVASSQYDRILSLAEEALIL